MSFERHTGQPVLEVDQCGHPTTSCVCSHDAFAHLSGRCNHCLCERFESRPCRLRKGKCGYVNGKRRAKRFDLELQVTAEAMARYEDEEERQRVADPSKCGIYFIQCEGFIKIGKTMHVDRRLMALQLANPMQLTLVGLIPCTSAELDELEGQFHRKFKSLHHRGEWFRYEDELPLYVMSLQERTA